MSRRSSPPLFVHLHHLNCVLLDPGSGCASPLSIDSITFGVVTWSTSRISMVQVGQMVLDRYSFVTNYKQDDWACWLPMVQFTHNNWPSDTTRKSPFFLLMGYNLHADWKHATSPLLQVTLHVDQFKEARAQAQNLMIKAQKSWVKH